MLAFEPSPAIAICDLDSWLRCYLQSAICNLLSAICYLLSAILPSAICYLPSAISDLSSAISYPHYLLVDHYPQTKTPTLPKSSKTLPLKSHGSYLLLKLNIKFFLLSALWIQERPWVLCMHECLAVCRLLGLVHMFSHNNIENVHVENQATDDFNVKNQAADLIAMLAILMRFAPRHI